MPYVLKFCPIYHFEIASTNINNVVQLNVFIIKSRRAFSAFIELHMFSTYRIYVCVNDSPAGDNI